MNDILVLAILTGLLVSFTINVYLIGLHNGRERYTQRLYDSYSKLYNEWNNALNKAKNDDNKAKQLECLSKIAAMQEMITTFFEITDKDTIVSVMEACHGIRKKNRKL